MNNVDPDQTAPSDLDLRCFPPDLSFWKLRIIILISSKAALSHADTIMVYNWKRL